MRFSFYLPAYWPDTRYPAEKLYADMLEQAKLADELGFLSLHIPEHHFINYLTHPNPLMTAIRVAGVTRRVRFVTAVLVLPFFDVRRLAGEIALADHLAEGRIEIGVGRGAFRYEFDRLDAPFEESREMFDESLAALKALLSGYEVSWQGKYYNFAPITIMPRPRQQPHPPLWLAAVKPEAIYHSVLNGYNVMTTPLRNPFEEAKAQADAFFRAVDDAGAAAAGRRFALLRMCYVARDPADAREKVAMGLENEKRHFNLRSVKSEIVNGEVLPLRTDKSLEDVEKALVIGDADACLERLRAYADLGIHEFVVNMGFGASHADVMASLERFGTKILPHFEPADGLRVASHGAGG